MSSQSSASSSPASAYRTDVGNASALGDDDDAWLAIASLVHLAARVSAAKERRRILGQGIDRAQELIGTEFIREYARIEWRSRTIRISPILVLAQEIQDVGGLHLAGVLLDDLVRAAPNLQPLWRGRLLALRARIAWKQGLVADAHDRYALIYGIGVRARVPELKARAEIGRIALAQLSGNLPAVYTHSKRATALAARAGNRGVTRLAYQGLTVGLVGRNDYEGGLSAAWRVFDLSKGYPNLEAEALQNIGQIMLQTGHPAEARSCFTAVLSRRVPDRVSLAALGALALASARLDIESTVEWSVREIWRARSLPFPSYELANALLEGAQALRTLGRVADAARYRDAAQPIAAEGQFHQLVFAAEQLTKEIANTREFRKAESESIAERIRAFDDRLPKTVEFEATAR